MLEQSATDIHKNGVDETKCIEGTFKMFWDADDKSSIEALVATREHRFRVSFQLCAKYLDVLHALRAEDKFRLSLRGAKLQKLKTIIEVSTIPLCLLFSDGVELQWKRPGDNIECLNTWQEHDEQMQSGENSWFMSPADKKGVSRSKLLQVPKRRHDETNTADQPKEFHNEAAQREKVSHTEKKRRRLEEKGKRRAEERTPTLSTAADQHSFQYTSRSSDDETGSFRIEHGLPPSQSLSPKLKAGLRSGTTVYPPIRDVETGTCTSLIGVITSISSPDVTHKGDWMRFVQIVDPSIYETNPSGMKINCFTKAYPEWLPTAEYGDVVILRRIKIQSFRGNVVGTGYHDQLVWAACSPPGRIHHGPPNNAPKALGLAPGGFGVHFSPFYQPSREEILYCVKLSDWWREVQKEEQKHLQHSGLPSLSQGYAARRVHRLISEAGPTVPPDGYFDCTVEVLQGFLNESGVYTLYVTDYTRNEQSESVQSHWCSPSLSDKVLRIEMWDAAAQQGPSMKPGEYFCIRNARVLTNHYTGYLQAKLQQNKIMHLKESEVDTNPHLKALLERKRQWEQNQPNLENETQHRLMEDFEVDKFLACTVEILRAVKESNEGPFIYVTDYTSHQLLRSVKLDEPWAQGLTGSILKIFLVEGQKRMAESVVPGSFYCIRKLRWKYSQVNQCIRAQLGGSEKLITMLNPNQTHNEHLNGLLRRKEAWDKIVRVHLPDLKQSSHQTLRPGDRAEAKQCDPVCIRIKDIPSPLAGPMQLKVYAKPVSFYPMDLDDAFYQFCARCSAEIPETRQACIKCDDFEHEHVEIRYQIYLIIEDEDKEKILISINDTNDIWDGLKRVRPRDDESTAKQLRMRLSSLLGNLPLVHGYYSNGQTLPKRTSFFNFELHSWVDEVKGRNYTFCKYS